MNGGACCILELCCEGTAAAETALATELVADGVVTAADAAKVAAWILTHFDLAERGTLRSLKQSWIRHITSHP